MGPAGQLVLASQHAAHSESPRIVVYPEPSFETEARASVLAVALGVVRNLEAVVVLDFDRARERIAPPGVLVPVELELAGSEREAAHVIADVFACAIEKAAVVVLVAGVATETVIVNVITNAIALALASGAVASAAIATLVTVPVVGSVHFAKEPLWVLWLSLAWSPPVEPRAVLTAPLEVELVHTATLQVALLAL